MSGGLDFDEDASRRVESLYLTPDVVAQRCEILRALDLKQGERVLDIGSGPGLLAYDMASTVGPEGRVCGVDISEPMLAMSRKRCAQQDWVEFDLADVCKLPYADNSFDAAVSTQVYEYVHDIAGALAELLRVLRPGGRTAVLDTDYDSLVMYSENPNRMERILSAWDEHFVHAGLPRTLTSQLRDAGFVVSQRAVIPMFNPEYHSNTYSYHFIGIVASFAVGRQGITQDEADAWAGEFDELGKQGKYFFSLNRYLFVADKPASL